MESSFLLLSCTVHKQKEVADKLCKIKGVKEAIPVYGVFDCVVKTDAMSQDDVKLLVSSSIRPVNGIVSVLILTTPEFLHAYVR